MFGIASWKTHFARSKIKRMISLSLITCNPLFRVPFDCWSRSRNRKCNFSERPRTTWASPFLWRTVYHGYCRSTIGWDCTICFSVGWFFVFNLAWQVFERFPAIMSTRHPRYVPRFRFSGPQALTTRRHTPWWLCRHVPRRVSWENSSCLTAWRNISGYIAWAGWAKDTARAPSWHRCTSATCHWDIIRIWEPPWLVRIDIFPKQKPENIISSPFYS